MDLQTEPPDICARVYSFTFSSHSLSVSGSGHAKPLCSTESPAVKEYWQVDNISHVVMAIDV